MLTTGAYGQGTMPAQPLPQPLSPGVQQQYPELPIYPSRPPSYPAQPPSYPAPGDSSGGSSSGSSDKSRTATESGGDPSMPQFDTHPRGGSADNRPSPAAPAPMAVLTPVTENDITYLCGGVGLDEAAQMKQAARDYDLLLTFAARDGSYLANVTVDIADARHKSLLKVMCDAPMMLLDLPRSGSYRLRAETGGYTVTRSVRIQDKERGKAVVMVWPGVAAGIE